MKQRDSAAKGWLTMIHREKSIGKAMTSLAAVIAFSSTPLYAQDTGRQAPATTTPPAETQAAPQTPPPSLSPIERARQAGTPVAEPAPAPSQFDQAMSDVMTDETVPYVIAGAAGLGLLALLGTGILTRRRKHRREQEDLEAKHRLLANAARAPAPLELDRRAEVRPGPQVAQRSPRHDPVPIRNAPVTKLPRGFDLSRFGPNVQAAYRGPTEDNPSLSLKNRLRRAAALDQQERMRAEEAPIVSHARMHSEFRTGGDFMFRRTEVMKARESERS